MKPVEDATPVQFEALTQYSGAYDNLIYVFSSLLMVGFLALIFVMLGNPNKKQSSVDLDVASSDKKLFKQEVGGNGHNSRKRQAKEQLVPKFEVA